MREICAQTLYFEEEFPEEPGDWGRDESEVKEPRTPEPGSVILTGAEKEASEGRNFVPEHFYRPARQKGTLRRVRYLTKNYASDGKTREKDAVVYLPYGYDRATDETRCNVLYLLHGSGGSEISYMGSEEEPQRLKHMADHMIEEGLIEPMIFVMPTYVYSREELGQARATALTFYKELINDLIPAVEGQFRTYAADLTAEGIRRSRGHRAFGGFSLGSVAAWEVFARAMDTAKYYLTLCGDCWAYEPFGGREHPAWAAEYLSRMAKKSGYGLRDYFIFTATGTEDSAYEMLPPMVAELRKHPDAFVCGGKNYESGNLVYYLAEGYKHSYGYTCDYIYNALQLFFRQERADEERTKAPGGESAE